MVGENGGEGGISAFSFFFVYVLFEKVRGMGSMNISYKIKHRHRYGYSNTWL